MTQLKREWKVVVPVDSPDGIEWKEAWDNIIPGFKSARFDSDYEATIAARQLRSTLVGGADGFEAATTDLPIE